MVDECAHSKGYTTHANRDLVSFGVSAIGHVGSLYVQNHKVLAHYEEAIAQGALPSQRGTTLRAVAMTFDAYLQSAAASREMSRLV